MVRREGDSTPLAELPTQTEARAEGRNNARQFCEPAIHVHEPDGECHAERIDPDFTAPTAKDVKPGPKVEP